MLPRRPCAVLGVVAGLAVLLAGCRSPERPAPAPGPVRPDWREVTLPVPPGAAGRLVLRDAAACGGRWFVVGAVADAAGGTRPAAWSSVDGVSWSALPVRGESFYGRQHVLYAVACRDGRIAALGAKNGGVHGNPRTGTWVQRPDGSVREVPAGFELFGGQRAVAASRLAAGPGGWLIAGARVDGAAVWTSPDASGFVILEGVPELAGDGRGRTAAYDAVAGPSGWLVVGSLLPAGGAALAPLAWTSADGRAWRRAELPTPDGRGRAQRVVLLDGEPVAVGPVRDGFAAWRPAAAGPVGESSPSGPPAGSGRAAQWRRVGGFGAAGPGVLSVVGLAAVGRRLVAVTGDGAGRRLWASADGGASWRAVTLPGPAAVPDSGDTALTVAGGEDRLLLLADDGGASHAWWAPPPLTDR
ncbi:hypothetical protein C5N14_20570 [Micromonospora sp. MW-13]|uniref:hypothetical protein n=1 Tax=Micromonospora sp. MW-13 TaxID=2094022 RepID=UPI000E446024|nr:hypothetical protein [Micromonospora sp. MW-13]RGC67068.1 hypothetical protein C5N14_20570 [Micromonospora sp. MW-13]